MIGEVLSQWLLNYQHIKLGKCFIFVFDQSLGNLPANYFWIEGTDQMIEWVINCWCSAGDLGNPQAMNCYGDDCWTAHRILVKYCANSLWTISNVICFFFCLHECINVKAFLKVLLLFSSLWSESDANARWVFTMLSL